MQTISTIYIEMMGEWDWKLCVVWMERHKDHHYMQHRFGIVERVALRRVLRMAMRLYSIHISPFLRMRYSKANNDSWASMQIICFTSRYSVCKRCRIASRNNTMWEYGASLSYGFGTRSSLTLQNVYILSAGNITLCVCIFISVRCLFFG